MTDVQRPPTLTLRSRTGAAKPTLWPTLNPCHFTVPCFIFKTKTFSFSSKQALSKNLFGVKIGRTATLRRLFKVINFPRSKFVCTLSPCPVFGMCAGGLATHLTTPVCPVARTQTIILQVVYIGSASALPILYLALIYYQLHVADEPKPSMIAHRTWAIHSNGQCLWVLWFMSMLQRVCQARLPCTMM